MRFEVNLFALFFRFLFGRETAFRRQRRIPPERCFRPPRQDTRGQERGRGSRTQPRKFTKIQIKYNSSIDRLSCFFILSWIAEYFSILTMKWYTEIRLSIYSYRLTEFTFYATLQNHESTFRSYLF